MKYISTDWVRERERTKNDKLIKLLIEAKHFNSLQLVIDTEKEIKLLCKFRDFN